MNRTNLDIWNVLVAAFAKDDRITVWHMATMFGIVQLADSPVREKGIMVSRNKVMKLAHINSIVTYHKCIGELQRFGYIKYYPSYHPGIGSKILILKNSEAINSTE